MFGTNSAVCGLGFDENVSLTKPSPLKQLNDKNIVEISSSNQHTLILLDNGGVLSCGSNNEYNQTGREVKISIPLPITKLEAFVVTSVASGGQHSVIATKSGQGMLFSLGIFSCLFRCGC